MPGATIVDFILRLWHDSPSNTRGKAPFTVQKFLLSVGYKDAEAWTTGIDWGFDFWALPNPPIMFCNDEEKNVETWEKLKVFVAALSKSSSKSKNRKGAKAVEEPQTLTAMKMFVKQSGDDGYSQGRTAFCNLVGLKWYKENRIMDQLVKATKDAQCYPFSVSMEEYDVLNPGSLQLLPSLELEVSQIAAELILGEVAFRQGPRLDICTEFQSGIKLLVSNFFWYNHCRKRVKNKIKVFNKAKDEMDALLKVPENKDYASTPEAMEHLRKGYFKYASISEQFKNDAIVLDHRKKVKDLLDILNVTLEKMSTQAESGKMAVNRFSKLMLSNMKSLNTPESIQSMRSEIQEWLERLECMSKLTEKLEIPEVQEDMDEWVEDPLGAGDLGVEAWKDKTKDGLRHYLGWGDSDGPYIQPVGSTMEQSGEDQKLWGEVYASFKLGEKLPEGFYAQEAMWHQLVAVAVIVQHFFKSQSHQVPPSSEGMAIIDEVGLGKTLEVILTIGFLNGLIDGRRAQKADPPLLDGQPYLSGYKEVPNRPHLIVVPNTLIPQWKHSLTCWLKQGSADVLVYAEGKRAKNEFWATNGPYESSLFKKSGELHRIVILASKEAVGQDHRIYTGQDKGLKTRSSTQAPWIPIPPTTRPTATTVIQNHSFLSMWVDEAHIYRNGISPLVSMARSCAMLVALTATPLFTGHKDLLSIGHLLNFSNLCSPVAMEKNKAFTSCIEKARVAHRTAMTEGSDGCMSNELRSLVNAQLEPVSWLKDFFKDHIIRRTGESKDFEGKPLIGLCPYRPMVITITLTSEEMESLQAAHKDCRGAGRRDGTLFDPWAFYSGPRQENLSPGLDKKCRFFDSQDDFKERGGTKLKALVSLISFFVQYGNVVDPILDSKGALGNDTSSFDSSKGSSVLVYCHWLRQVDLIQSALRVNSINSESATSSDTVHVRNTTLMAFSSKEDRNRKSCQVLIISGVGTTGLNITTANVVIFAHKGQTKPVTVVWLLAEGTTDTLLYQFAQGKARQSEAFLSKAKAFLGCQSDGDGQSDSQSDSESSVKDLDPPHTQAQGHKRKPSKDIGDKEKKQKTQAGPKKKVAGLQKADKPSLSCPVSISPSAPSPTPSKEAPVHLNVTRSDSIDDDFPDFFESMVQGLSPASLTKDAESFPYNRGSADYPEGAMSTTTHPSPVLSSPNSPGPSIAGNPPSLPIPRKPLYHNPATSLTAPAGSSRLLPSSKDSSQSASRAGPTGSSSAHRNAPSRLEVLPSDSDNDDPGLTIKPYASLMKKKGSRGH